MLARTAAVGRTNRAGTASCVLVRHTRAAPTYEQARRTMDVVRRLESGGVTLEDSLALWEGGEALARICQD